MYSGDVFHPGIDRPPKGACISTGVELFRALLGEASDRPRKLGGKFYQGRWSSDKEMAPLLTLSRETMEHGNDNDFFDEEDGLGEDDDLDEEDDHLSDDGMSVEDDNDNDDDLMLIERNDPGLLIFDIGMRYNPSLGWEVLGESIGRNTMLNEVNIIYEPLSELGMPSFEGSQRIDQSRN